MNQRRTLSLLLAAVMLLVMLPAAIVPASADDTPTVTQTAYASYTIPAGLTVVDVENTSGTNSGVDWSTLPLDSLTANLGNNYGEATEITIVGTFDSAVSVHSIVLNRNSKYAQRMKGFQISLSADGETWTDVVTLGNDSAGAGISGNNVVTVTLPESLASNEYRYVKLSRTATGWTGLGGVIVLTADTSYVPVHKTGSTRIATEHYQSSAAAYAPVWSMNSILQTNSKDTAICSYSSARLASPTVIDKVVLDYGEQGARARGSLVYGSIDGVTWEQIGKVPETNTAFISAAAQVNSNKAYSYVKVEQAENLKAYDYSLLRVNVYGWAEDADRIAVTHMAALDSTADASDPVINLWSDDNKTARTGTDTDDIVEWTVAKFDFPTVISAIYMTSGDKAGRNRGIAYEGSKDGEHWTQILKSGHQNDSQYSNGTKRVAVNDENAYLYLRVRNMLESASGDYHWNVINLAVYGETPTVTAQGTQSKLMGDGTYAVRVVSTLDLLDYDATGFEITVTGEGIDGTKQWDRATSCVYTAISEGVYDEQSGQVVQTVRDASYFGAKYICALTLDNISIETYGALTFTIKAYIELNGERLYADTFTAVYNDGVYVSQ